MNTSPALDDYWNCWMERSGVREVLRSAKALPVNPSTAQSLRVLRQALRVLQGAALEGDPLAAAHAFRIVMALLRLRERGIRQWVEQATLPLLPLAALHAKRAPSGRHARWHKKREAAREDLWKYLAVRRARKEGSVGGAAYLKAAEARHEVSPEHVAKQYEKAFYRVRASLKNHRHAYTTIAVSLILKKHVTRKVKALKSR
ncbi:MAG TPA: hypothetical protein VFV75_09555 [Candidatus Polarisedimenticolaceae bacterium]|nr:hypothetical protein [Candidatus Polarisedimenticolaceae bacterium]